MKVLFLDFDGVLNSGEYIEECQSGAVISPKMVDYLSLIVRKTGCQVVVSSTWRIFHSVLELNCILREHGFIGSIYGTTPVHKDRARGNEIDEWLAAHPEVTSYVILDDEQYDMNEHQLSRLIKTDFKTGLQRQHYERAVQLFDTERPVTTP